MSESFLEIAKPHFSASLLVVWSFFHSFFADMGVKERIMSMLRPASGRWYRFIYVVLSAVTLIGVAVPVCLWPGEVIWDTRGAIMISLNVIRFAALAGLLITAARTDMGDFLGFKQIRGRKTEDRLVTHGAYRWVRHPLYSLGLLVIWASPIMKSGGMSMSVVASLYLWLGTYHEENGLRRVFGKEYDEYAGEVPRLFPTLRLRN